MTLQHPPHDPSRTPANPRAAPPRRGRESHGLVRLMRQHAECLRRRDPLGADEEVFLKLLAEIERGYVWLLFRGAPSYDAEEVVQTSLEKLYERHEEIPPEKRPAWLSTAIRTTNLERRRKWAIEHKLAPEVANETEVQSAGVHRETDVQLGELQLHADVQRLLHLLRPEEQAVVEHHVFHDRTIEATAEALGIPLTTAWKRWRRAVVRLCEHIEREDAQEGFRSGGCKRYVLPAAVLLWAWARRWYRAAAGLERDTAIGAKRAARWPIVAAAIPLVAISIFALSSSATPAAEVTPAAEIAPAGEAIEIDDTSTASVGLFLSTWAEREREQGDSIAITAPASHARSAARMLGATPVPPLLSKAREALQLGHLTEAASALHDFEVDHPDPTKNTMHRDLRVQLELRGLDVAPLRP